MANLRRALRAYRGTTTVNTTAHLLQMGSRHLTPIWRLLPRLQPQQQRTFRWLPSDALGAPAATGAGAAKPAIANLLIWRAGMGSLSLFISFSLFSLYKK
jgi:hypothetical protein